MTGFWSFISILVATAVAGLIVVALQQPVSMMFNSDRLRADYYPGPWRPYPEVNPRNSTPRSPQSIEEMNRQRFLSGEHDDFPIALLEITNPGREEVRDISIVFPYKMDAIVRVQEGKQFVAHEQDRMVVDPLQPGESARLYVFFSVGTNFSDFARIQTFSSQGPIVLNARHYKRKVSGDYTYEFIDEHGVLLFSILLFLIVGLCIFYAALQEHYYRQLLGDPAWYSREQKRFALAPNSFKPMLKEELQQALAKEAERKARTARSDRDTDDKVEH
ncbi:MAG: hypothetical protein JNJ73_07630 [Hyphomonadaceae bacterium]|nr:hypothetical protein [Hyphomonadaceae bacterium]